MWRCRSRWRWRSCSQLRALMNPAPNREVEVEEVVEVEVDDTEELIAMSMSETVLEAVTEVQVRRVLIMLSTGC